jgi:histidine transport system substrate-binding protein
MSVCVLIVMLMGVAAGARGADLRFGTEADDAPFSQVTPQAPPTGFSVDIGNEICRRMKVRCVWIGMPFSELFPALKAGRIDAALSQITVTPARSAQVLFTEPVTAAGSLVIVPSLSEITNAPKSMEGKTIGVQQGTTHDAYAEAVIKPVARLKLYPTQDAAFRDLVAGRIDATICDMELGHAWLEQHAGAFRFADKPIDDPRTGASTAIALRPGDDGMRARIDYALKAMRRDGTFTRINKRYFTFSIAPGSFGAPL